MFARIRLSPTIALTGALVVAAAIVAVGSGSTQATAQQDKSSEGPRVIAAKFHADWCALCQKMGPTFEDLQAEVDEEPVLYVTFDLTDDFDRRQSQYLAHAMNVQDVWKEQAGKTGFVLLIDCDSRQVVQTLTHDQSAADMSKAVHAALKSAGSGDHPTGEHPDHPKKSDHPEHPKPKSDHPDHPK